MSTQTISTSGVYTAGMSLNYTPGPWITGSDESEIVSTDGKHIATMRTALGRIGPEERAANQRLAKAAPELAEALRALTKDEGHERTAWAAGYEHIPESCRTCRGEAALRKAGLL